MKNKLIGFVICIVLAGCGLVIGGIWAKSAALLNAGVSVITVAVAALAAIFGVKTWQDERRQTVAEHQRNTYVALARNTMKRYTGQCDVNELAEIRADITSWGTRDVVDALAQWNQAYSQNVGIEATGVVSLGNEAGKKMADATAHLIGAIRGAILGNAADPMSEVMVKQALFD